MNHLLLSPPLPNHPNHRLSMNVILALLPHIQSILKASLPQVTALLGWLRGKTCPERAKLAKGQSPVSPPNGLDKPRRALFPTIFVFLRLEATSSDLKLLHQWQTLAIGCLASASQLLQRRRRTVAFSRLYASTQMSQRILSYTRSLTIPSDGGAFGLSQSSSSSRQAQLDTQCRTIRHSMKKLLHLHRLHPFPRSDMDSLRIPLHASLTLSGMALGPRQLWNTNGVWTPDHPG